MLVYSSILFSIFNFPFALRFPWKMATLKKPLPFDLTTGFVLGGQH